MTDRDGPPLDRQGLEQLKNLTAEEIIAIILPRGHAINGYSSASSERVIKIVPDKNYTGDGAPLLGFGVDGDAERLSGHSAGETALLPAEWLDYHAFV